MNAKAFLFVLPIVLLSTWFPPASARAQNYEAMIQQELQKGQAMNAQMQAMQRGIVQQNMQNPRVREMYQGYLRSGGTLSFETYAYNYAATGGFTPEGMARYRLSESQIQQNERRAIEDYRASQAASAEALGRMHERNSEIAHARGNLLNGTTDYRNPRTGAEYNLPHTLPDESVFRDPASGNVFRNDAQGNYQEEEEGTWEQLEAVE